MNCKYLKIKINKKFECKKTNRIINLKDCTNCKYKEYKSNSHQVKKKSSKLSKLERNRYSIFTEDLNTCFYANKECFGSITKHELFSGRNRQRSMRFGYVIGLCEFHHSTLQENKEFNQYWHNRCREYWLEHYGSIDEFIKVFGKSYIK